ncbi:MAG: homoserine dehydrogenase [Deltaproteobacteria bacterium RIFOXYD12_FULL_50_9]|nr:MAG: homoserine dehydrogenase [Deltaproteobacteria bacterium RIFOXYD12_FULL_50_9]
MKEILVGLIGFGTVGSGLAEVLQVQAARLAKKVDTVIRLKTIADNRLAALPERFNDVGFTKNAREIIADPQINIVVELIGGIEPAKTFILEAIAAGKHVVTANKALISQHGAEIFAAAAKAGVEIGFEASVGGGVPVIKALKEGLVANRILSIMGIMNGTANFILNQMTDHQVPFSEVLKDAQAKGYAEADPTYDVEGIDTAHKLAILMNIAYGMNVSLADISIEGITRIDPVDIAFAREFGYRIKLLAISRNHGEHVEARVHPTMVPENHMLAGISGVYNGFYFTGDMVGNIMLYGLGAGKMPTGSAVAADVVDIARNITHNSINRVPSLSFRPEHLTPRRITPIEDLRCPYYFRMTAVDKPGVLSAISGILGKNNISIESVIQKSRGQKDAVPVVIMTYEAEERSVRAALAEIDSLPICTDKTVKIRILVDKQDGVK